MANFEKVLPDTYLLKTRFGELWSGVYLLTGEQNILVDTGAYAETVDNEIVPALKQLSMTPKHIDWIINTHSHGDHVGGNRRLLELSDGHIKVAAYEGAVDKIENPLHYGREIRMTYPKHSPPPQSVLDGCPVDLSLAENDALGKRLRVIHTPGHDSECICLLDLQTNALFTGDTLQGFGTAGLQGAAGLVFYRYLPQYRKSLKKIAELRVDHILSAHDYIPYGCFAHGEQEVNRYLEACKTAIDICGVLTRRALDEGCTDTAEIARRLIRSMGAAMPEKLFMAMFTVDQHIAEIREGRYSLAAE